MIFKERKHKGVFEIELKPIGDERGSFVRVYDSSFFDLHKLSQDWVQENHSKTVHKGTIRGLHFQFPPFAETKLIRCLRGAILNVFVDLREDSDTFGQWDAVELTEENNKLVYLPKGFANGFCILKDNSEILYKTDTFYNPDYEGRLRWDDLDVKIKWPFEKVILSEKDKNNMSLREFQEKHGAIVV